MEIFEHVENGATILDIHGRLDVRSRRAFWSAIGRAQENGRPHLVINLEGLSFVDSSGLGLLILAYQYQKRLKQGRLSLLNPQGHVRQILELANIPMLIPVYTDLQDTLEGKACAPGVMS